MPGSATRSARGSNAAMPSERRPGLVPTGPLPAAELLLHLSVGGDRWRRASNVARGRVDDGDGIAGALS